MKPINGTISFPQIKSGADSVYYSVWAESKSDSPMYIWANRFVGSAWESAKVIGVSEQAISTEPQIAVDNAGNAFAVWIQERKESPEASEVWGAYYNVNSGWGSAEYIGGQQKNRQSAAKIPRVVMNGVGNAVVVWQQHEVVDNEPSYRARTDLWARSYSVDGGGWGSAELIETDDSGSARNAQLAIFSDGSVIAAWQQHDGIRDNIWANHYVPNEGWGSAELIENSSSGSTHSVQITSDHLGNAIAVWVQESATKAVWSNRYTSDAGWGIAEPIESSSSDYLGSVRVASEGVDGTAVAVWFGSDGESSDILTSRYTIDEGWSAIEAINAMSGELKISPRITSNKVGYSTVLWSQLKSGSRSLWSNIRTPGVGWGEAKRIYNNISGDYSVALNRESGGSMALWIHGYQSLQSSFFKPDESWKMPEKVNIQSEEVKE